MFKKLMFILFVMPAGLIGCGNGSSNMVKNHNEEIILKPHLYYIEILKTNGYEEIFPDGFFINRQNHRNFFRSTSVN